MGGNKIEKKGDQQCTVEPAQGFDVFRLHSCNSHDVLEISKVGLQLSQLRVQVRELTRLRVRGSKGRADAAPGLVGRRRRRSGRHWWWIGVDWVLVGGREGETTANIRFRNRNPTSNVNFLNSIFGPTNDAMGSPVTALAARLALTTEAMIARRLVLNRHAAAATSIWPGATITSVGSFAQNTSLRGRYFSIFPYLI